MKKFIIPVILLISFQGLFGQNIKKQIQKAEAQMQKAEAQMQEAEKKNGHIRCHGRFGI